mmetsp:Transcript_11888/g.18237  ORF Transcript_11888/g.18237 Transcript_11888/m.18237 type:complete len:338 (-) Transcript_11888:118-1131(-)
MTRIATALEQLRRFRATAPHLVLRNQEDHDVEALNARNNDTTPRQGGQRDDERDGANELFSEEYPSSEDNDVEQAGDSSSDETGGVEDDLENIPELQSGRRMGVRPTLHELEEEREIVRRRTSVCLLLAIFLLFRLWYNALIQSDLGLLLLCMVLTSWCARYIRYNREREEELDRRINNYDENNGEDPDGLNPPDLRMLSFQAQLALAIMESQRQMMEGGFGHPDGQQGQEGVSDEAREQWERFSFKTVDAPEEKGKKKGAYGSLVQDDDDEEPSCTICLCEYENGDALVRLPCNHIYHEECITSWTDGHSKCPLCNVDLESIAETETSSNAPSSRD